MNWKQGENVIIVPAVSDTEAQDRFPGGGKAPKPYLESCPSRGDAWLPSPLGPTLSRGFPDFLTRS